MSLFNKIRFVDPITPEKGAIDEAVRVMKAGGVIVFPTSGLYGLGVEAFNVAAIRKIFDLKGRDLQKPLLVLVHEMDAVRPLVDHVSPAAKRLMDHFWPGKLTLVFNASEKVPLELTAGTGKIGIRVVQHPVASALTGAMACPITGTSANRSGFSACSRIETLDASLKHGVDLVLDAGPLMGGAPSTVVDVTGNAPVILRSGAISPADIRDAIAFSRAEKY